MTTDTDTLLAQAHSTARNHPDVQRAREDYLAGRIDQEDVESAYLDAFELAWPRDVEIVYDATEYQEWLDG